jgi:hypothetical protein
MRHLSHIEPLEARIAPATIINPYTVTFQDGDGDTAVVHISKSLFTNATAAGRILLFTDNNGNSIQDLYQGNGSPENLSEIDLLGRTDAQGMNISVKVLPQVGVGNLQVNVGDIAAANFSVPFQVSQNIDLGSIYIQGNLGQITAGDNFSTPAIQSLTVLSMNEALQSNVLGPIVSMNVQGNFSANLSVIGYQFGSIGRLNIGGSLTGDALGDSNTGVIEFTGHVGVATIGSITGTSANGTGELIGVSAGPSYIGSLHVLGSITGGAGSQSGEVFAEASIGRLTVGGSVTGGSGAASGLIAGPLGTVNISGSLTGGSGLTSGTLLGETVTTSDVGVAVPIGSVKIGGDVTGGTAGVAATSTTTASPGDAGVISAVSAKSITIGGSLIGGAAGTTTNSSGTLDQTADTCGDILVNSVNTLTIVGNITGGTGPNSGIVTGQNALSESPNIAGMKYGSIWVSGDVAGGTGNVSGSILIDGALGGAVTSLHIGGSLTGNSGTQSGEVESTTSMGTLSIGGSVTGGSAGTAAFAGTPAVGSTPAQPATNAVPGDTGLIDSAIVRSIMIGGSLTGGTPGTSVDSNGTSTATADTSGAIIVTALNSLSIGGNITGGGGPNSGGVSAGGNLGTLFVGGTVTGGLADNTGEIFAGDNLTSAVINGNLAGNTLINSATAVVGSGYIQAGHIGTLNIKGSVSSGANSGGELANSGAIRSAADILSLTIGGAVTGTAKNPVLITAAQGLGTTATSKTDLAIKSVTIDGAATYLDVLAGYSPTVSTNTDPAGAPLGTPVDGSAQIGIVTFGSTLSASNVAAGAMQGASGQFGNADNTAITPVATNVLSSIASIVVTGQATGDSTAGDSYGFEARQLLSIEVNGLPVSTANLTVGTPEAVNGTNLFLLRV